MKMMCEKRRASMNDGMKVLKMYIGWMEKCRSNVISKCIQILLQYIIVLQICMLYDKCMIVMAKICMLLEKRPGVHPLWGSQKPSQLNWGIIEILKQGRGELKINSKTRIGEWWSFLGRNDRPPLSSENSWNSSK